MFGASYPSGHGVGFAVREHCTRLIGCNEAGRTVGSRARVLHYFDEYFGINADNVYGLKWRQRGR